MTAAALTAGYVADLLVGDPRRGHPVAGFGRLARATESAVYAPGRARGVGFAASLVALAALAGVLAEQLARASGLGRQAAVAAFSWAALGGRSLRHEARRIAADLATDDLASARGRLPALAGRDPSSLDSDGITRAVVESVAENTSDAVVGTLVWGTVGGSAGIAAYRAANTLDAMVGHRSSRYSRFGWAAARLDDAMSWPAARLGAGLAVVCAPAVGGSAPAAWRTLRRDGGGHPSPNAGRMEAAFAGALGVRLGGAVTYEGRIEMRPQIGDGPPPGVADVARAARLSSAVGALALALCVAVTGWSRR